MAAVDPQIFQAALLEVAEATKAASKAAQAAQAAVSSQAAGPSPSGSPTGSSSVDWSKLLSRPPLFEHKTTEDEIRAFRDWSWMLIQYLNAIDSGFEKELQQLMDDPTNALDLTTASAETRNRSSKLYGMLASLCRNRSLNIIRSVKNTDGYEALRQLVLALRPSTSGRGLALMAALTSWPQFSMNQPLQPQLLKLEDALEEARRAGTTIPDQLQQAILLKCVSGQLRTHLNLAIQDTTSFKDLREHVLKWDRSQQKWAGLLFSSDDTSAAIPMEVDRVHGGGKKGGKDKGKGSQQKGQQKGKSKGKSKSKQDGKSGYKGKSKSDGKGKTGGKQHDVAGGKGKGYSRSDVCYRCGNPGHYAKDCNAWGQSVRNVQNEGQQQPYSQAMQTPQTPSSATAGGSPSSSAPQQSATQFRVARIHECDTEFHQASDVSKHGEVVFDLRSPVTSPSRQGGSVRVMRFYIGEEPQTCLDGSVRAVLETMPEDSNMYNILLDSGADASIFPASMAGLGVESEQPVSKLQDAQGNVIPIDAMRDVELHLADRDGRAVILRETVAVSRHVTQPIMCYGHLMSNGWSVNAAESTLEHGCGVSVPIEMQNQSLAIRGWIRVLKDEQQDTLTVRAVRADVVPDLSEMRIGWQLNDEGVGRGKHVSNCFQDPTLVCPSMSGAKYRTTLVRDGGQWLVLELCERLDALVDLSAEFHGLAGDRYVLTVITDAEKAPQVMGFRSPLEFRGLGWGSQSVEAPNPTPLQNG